MLVAPEARKPGRLRLAPIPPGACRALCMLKLLVSLPFGSHLRNMDHHGFLCTEHGPPWIPCVSNALEDWVRCFGACVGRAQTAIVIN